MNNTQSVDRLLSPWLSLMAMLAFALLAHDAWLSPAHAADAASTFYNPGSFNPLLVTSDGVGTHTTTPGTPVTFSGHPLLAPLNVDGVAELIIQKGAIQVSCTGTLMQGGTAIVTAAHCMTDAVGTKTVNLGSANWQLSGGPVSVGFGAANVTVHPSWNGNFAGLGNDIAVISLGAPVNPLVPRYDINRSLSDVNVGDPRIKVGYGQTGVGSTGATVVNGVKRAGLNSFDGLWVNANIVASDFDNGLAANDALGVAFGVNHTGFGIHEVGAAPGDSGGPTFYEANDSLLTLSPDTNLGKFIVGNVPSQLLTATKDGSNSTNYSIAYTGDHSNVNVASTPFVGTGDLTDHKIAAITSAGGQLDNDADNNGIPEFPQPDVNGGTNSSWGEVNIDTRVSSFQAFIDPFLGPAPGPANQSVPLTINDATPGAKSATVTIDNLATTSELSGRGSSDANNSATYTATVVGHSNASFDSVTDQNSLLIDFGLVPQFSSPADIAFDIYNLDPNGGFTAFLDLDSITPAGDFSTLITDLALFLNLNPAASNSYLASIVTTTLGSFSATYTLGVSDENIPGALSGTSLVLTITGEIFAPVAIEIPEPSTLLLVSVALAGAAVRRQRVRNSAKQD